MVTQSECVWMLQYLWLIGYNALNDISKLWNEWMNGAWMF